MEVTKLLQSHGWTTLRWWQRTLAMTPLKVGISKLKVLPLGDITAFSKEGHLTWYSFRQWLIEHYSNMPYVSDVMYAYSHMLQGNEKPTTKYLSRAQSSIRGYSPQNKVIKYSRCWLGQYVPG